MDEFGTRHKSEALAWLAATPDIYRRVKPRTPSPHLVSYFLLLDRAADGCCLGIEARFDPLVGPEPFFLTVTETVGPPSMRHTDVSLWFALEGSLGEALIPDEREFFQVRWWSRDELRAVDASRLEPHLFRALDALGL